jgi:antitoxin MazE
MGARSRLVKIGNSRGIRVPKSLIEECGLGDEVELTVEEGALVVRPVDDPRAGWEEAFRRMAERGDDKLIDGDWPATEFDKSEWEW